MISAASWTSAVEQNLKQFQSSRNLCPVLFIVNWGHWEIVKKMFSTSDFLSCCLCRTRHAGRQWARKLWSPCVSPAPPRLCLRCPPSVPRLWILQPPATSWSWNCASWSLNTGGYVKTLCPNNHKVRRICTPCYTSPSHIEYSRTCLQSLSEEFSPLLYPFSLCQTLSTVLSCLFGEEC